MPAQRAGDAVLGFDAVDPSRKFGRRHHRYLAGGSADDIKDKLATYRASAKQKEAQLEKAQDELRQLLSVKQEARAVLMGLLK